MCNNKTCLDKERNLSPKSQKTLNFFVIYEENNKWKEIVPKNDRYEMD